MTVDDDIERLLNRPSLRDRAKLAAELAKRAENDAKLAQWGDLLHMTRDWLRDVLDLTEGEIAGIDFERRTRTDQRTGAYFQVDGLRFQSYILPKKVMTKKSSEYDDEEILEDTLVVTMCVGGGFDYRVVETLAEIGQRL